MNEQENQFHIGGVYRQRNGELVRMESAEAFWLCSRGEVAAFLVKDGYQLGARRLSDGMAYPYDDAESPYNLIPGELTQTPSGWVALGAEKQEPKPAQTLGDLLRQALDRGIGKAVARPGVTYVGDVPEGLTATPADLAMVARDGVPQLKPVIFGIDYAAGCAPSTAKPNPFASFRSPDCDSGPSDHLNASRHQMAGMKG